MINPTTKETETNASQPNTTSGTCIHCSIEIKRTTHTEAVVHQLLNNCETNPNEKPRHHASEIILRMYRDTSYLS